MSYDVSVNKCFLLFVEACTKFIIRDIAQQQVGEHAEEQFA